ncbi:MAG: DNA recombination protein RmuC [Bacteroidales bacterium]|nr:DNA recombination protein RmuC [Bacteroidales bacterium]
MESYLLYLLTFLVGCAVVYLFLSKEKTRSEVFRTERDALLERLKKAELDFQSQLEKEEAEHRELMEKEEEEHRLEMEDLKASWRERLASAERQYTEQHAKMEELFQKQMDQQMALMKEQMNTTSEKILKERSEELTSMNKEQLATILNPLNEHIKQMKEAVEKSDREHNSTMERLDATIKTSIEQSKEVGERADKLAQALTGENKTQGNFGELRLRQLLEGMGLEEGIQYEEQTTMRDADGRVIKEEEGHKLIPDVILHFPKNRDLIIDSKMSFTAFEDYYNADTEELKADALKRHLNSVKNHVMELSKKDYSKYIPETHERLDFVIMYMFSENALQLAFSADPGLWKWAYDKKVIITGSQNLFPMLRVLEMSWNQVRQVENQREIMEAANLVVDRVQLFYERIEAVENCLDKTANAFADLKNITAPNGVSIGTAARKLLKYGASENPKRKKSLPKAEN